VPVEYHERLAHAVRRSVRQTVPLALDVPVSSAGGESMTMRIVAEPLCGVDGRVETLRGVMRDVTEIRRAEADIERLTNVDPLTGLPNRNRFLAQCSEAIASARSCGLGVAVATFDLDRFAQINESLGQTAGDEVLCIVAGRLASDLNRLRGLRADADRAVALDDHFGRACAVTQPAACAIGLDLEFKARRHVGCASTGDRAIDNSLDHGSGAEVGAVMTRDNEIKQHVAVLHCRGRGHRSAGAFCLDVWIPVGVARSADLHG